MSIAINLGNFIDEREVESIRPFTLWLYGYTSQTIVVPLYKRPKRNVLVSKERKETQYIQMVIE